VDPLGGARRINIDFDSRQNQRLVAALNLQKSPEQIYFYQDSFQADSLEFSKDDQEKLITVIPIKAEVENGNIFNLIDDFNHQTHIKASDIRYVFAINNEINENGSECSWQENLKLIEIFKYINGDIDRAPEFLENWQLEILNQAREKQLNCDYIHIKLPIQKRCPIEYSRAFALNLVVEELKKNGRLDDVILTSFDADSRLEPDFFKSIFDQFNEHAPDVVSIDFDDIAVSGPPDLFKTHQLARFRALRKNIISSFITNNVDWRAYKASHQKSLNPLQANAFINRSFEINGKRVILPNLKMKSLDRVAKDSDAGAFSISRLNEVLEPRAFHQEIGNPKEYLGDYLERLEAQGSVFDADSFSQIQKDNKAFKDFYAQCDPQLKEKELSPLNFARFFEELVRFMIKDSEQEKTELDSMLNASISKEKITRDTKRFFIQEIFKQALASFRKMKPLKIEDVYKDGSRRNFFLKENSWLIKIINDAIIDSHDEEEAWLNLVDELPEYLKDFEDTEFSLANAKMVAIRNFIAKARSNPAAYPAFNLNHAV
jgi:hypothetical protein